MKRGEIYYIESTYSETGSEQRAGRPAVIVSNDASNKNSDVVEIVYTTTSPKKDKPTHVLLRSMPKPSVVICEQITSVSTSRLGTFIGRRTEDELNCIDIALAISLGLDIWQNQTENSPAPADVEDDGADTEELTEELEVIRELKEERDNLSTALIVAETERDVYQKLYSDLMATVTGGARFGKPL